MQGWTEEHAFWNIERRQLASTDLNSNNYSKNTIQGWDRKYLKKEEDNLARSRSDRGAAGVGRDFWDFWYQKQLF